MSRQSDMQRLEDLLAELRDVALRLGAIQHWDGDASYLHYSVHLTIRPGMAPRVALEIAPPGHLLGEEAIQAQGEGRGMTRSQAIAEIERWLRETDCMQPDDLLDGAQWAGVFPDRMRTALVMALESMKREQANWLGLTGKRQGEGRGDG